MNSPTRRGAFVLFLLAFMLACSPDSGASPPSPASAAPQEPPTALPFSSTPSTSPSSVPPQPASTAPGSLNWALRQSYSAPVNIVHDDVIIAGQTYYVAPNGDDANPGTREHPWASPGYASRQLRPGDTLIILGGRYVLSEYDADILTPSSGTANAWITIQGEPDHRPILAGRDNLATAINLSGVQYVRIANLEITHDDQAQGRAAWFRDGIQILGAPAAHIILEGLSIHHVDEFGMNIQDVDDLQILNTRIEYAGFGALGGPAGAHGGWRNVTIRGCSLSWSGHYYQGGDGSNRPYDRPDGFGIEPSQGPIRIEDTVAEHNYGDGLDSKAANTTIRRTIVANNSCDGIKLWGPNSRIENTLIYGRGDGNAEPTPWAAIVINQVETPHARFEIVNVTVDDDVGQNYLMYVQYDNPDFPVDLLLRNVIFSSRGPGAHIFIGRAANLTADHNLFYFPRTDRVLEHGARLYTAQNLGDLGPGNIYGDPRFIRPAWGESGDYHLQAGSPAVDAGVCIGAPTDDLDGDRRPQGPTCDIGADEFTSTSRRLIFYSAADTDGWIREATETANKGKALNNSATTLRLGDDTANRQYRSILSFDTQALPDNAVLTKVTLKVRQQGITGAGNPVTLFQGFILDVRKGTFGAPALEATDWQVAPDRSYGPFTPSLSGGWYTFDLTGAGAFINKEATNGGLTQIRLRFQRDDNNNAVADYLSLYSGNAAAAKRPQLLIEYQVP